MDAGDEWGAIQQGLAADMIILAKNPLADIDNTLTIADVIQAGLVIQRDELPVN